MLVLQERPSRRGHPHRHRRRRRQKRRLQRRSKRLCPMAPPRGMHTEAGVVVPSHRRRLRRRQHQQHPKSEACCAAAQQSFGEPTCQNNEQHLIRLTEWKGASPPIRRSKNLGQHRRRHRRRPTRSRSTYAKVAQPRPSRSPSHGPDEIGRPGIDLHRASRLRTFWKIASSEMKSSRATTITFLNARNHIRSGLGTRRRAATESKASCAASGPRCTVQRKCRRSILTYIRLRPSRISVN